MWFWDVIVPALFAATLTAGIVFGRSPALYRRFGSGKWIEKVGAPIDSATEEMVKKARGRRIAAASLGGLVGLLSGFTITRTVVDDDAFPTAFITVGPAMLGFAVGFIVHALTVVLRTEAGPVRVAHATADRVSDFVRPRALMMVRIAVVLATTACVLLALQPIWHGSGFSINDSGPIWVAAVLIPLSYLITEALVARLLHRSTPGVSPTSMVWHDAIRRELVGDIFSAPTMVVAASALAVYSWASNPWSDVDLPASWSFLVFLGFMGACNSSSIFIWLNEAKQPKAVVAA